MNARRGAVFWIAALATLGLLVVIVIGATSSDPTGAVRASVFSRAATGHAALLALLKKLDRPVVVSRQDSVGKARAAGDLLVMAEPVIGFSGVGDLSSNAQADDVWRDLVRTLDVDDVVLLVLPKRLGTKRHRENPQWLDSAPVATPEHAGSLSEIILPEMGMEVVQKPAHPDAAALGIEIDGVIQLVRGPTLTPLTEIGGDILLAETITASGATLYILSDPDLIANAGIGRGRNAEFVIGTLDKLRAGRGIVIDEMMHGFGDTPGLWDLLLRFPFVLVPITLGLFSLVLIAAASSGRVGKLLTPPPPLKAGRKVLIAAAGDMLAQGHHDRFLLSRYARLMRRQISNRLSPQRTDKNGTGAVLDDVRLTELAQRRDAGPEAVSLFGEAEAGGSREILPAARDLFNFKERMIGDRSARPSSRHRARTA